MSTSPTPNKTNVEETLQQVRTEMVESRNLTIKTDNLIKNLSAEVREITKRQELFEKRVVFNSVGAYLLYSVIIFVVLYLVFQSQVAKERQAVEGAQVRTGDLQSRVVQLEGELDRRRNAEEAAYSLYQMMEEKKQDEVLAQFPNIRGNLVNRAEAELLRAEVERTNNAVAEQAYRQGSEHFLKGEHEAARDAFLKSLRHVERTHYSPSLHFMLGKSLFELGDFKLCVDHLRKALEYKHDRSTTNEAVYHLAVALDKLGRIGEARTAYEAYARNFAFDKRAVGTQKRVFQFIREGVRPEGDVPGFSEVDSEQ